MGDPPSVGISPHRFPPPPGSSCPPSRWCLRLCPTPSLRHSGPSPLSLSLRLTRGRRRSFPAWSLQIVSCAIYNISLFGLWWCSASVTHIFVSQQQ
jgi:hypothetical protein